MTKRKLTAATVLLLVSLTAVLTTPATAIAQGSRAKSGDLNKSIQVRTKKTSAVTIGDTAWVAVSIRGKKNVDNVRFTGIVGEGGSVTYPANTADHSGPYNGYDLDRKETDYVAFNVTIPEELEARDVELKLSVTWTEDGEALTGETTVRIPVVQFDGAPYTLLTQEVTLTDADNGWVSLSFAGLAPRVEQLEVSVASPSGLDLYYPLDGYTSLAGDSLLEDGETDVARFRVNEAHWGQALDLEIGVRYLVAGVPETATHKVGVIPG